MGFPYSNVAFPAVLTIYDMSGSKMAEKFLDRSAGSLEASLKGVHVVTLRNADGTSSQKIVF